MMAPPQSIVAPESLVAQTPPAAALPPAELVRQHPKLAASIALSLLWGVLAVMLAMMAAARTDGGGAALWNLTLAGASIGLGLWLYRRHPHARWAALAAHAVLALSLIGDVAAGNASPLMVLLLMFSIVIVVLLTMEKAAFLPSVIMADGPSPASAATASIQPLVQNLTSTSPQPLKKAQKNPQESVGQLRGNSTTMFWLFVVLLIWILIYTMLQVTGAEPPAFVLHFLSLALWVGGAYATGYLWRNFRAVSQQPRPHAAYGLVGGIGLIVLFAIGVLGTAATLFTDGGLDLYSLITPASPVTFAELDSKFGAPSFSGPDAAHRTRLTAAQLEAELKPYLGRPVHWSGVVLQARSDGTVTLKVRPSTSNLLLAGKAETAAERQIAREQGYLGQDDVQVMLQLHSASDAQTLSQEQHIEFSGVLKGIGDPYPYMIEDARLE
jgi:hypothetical protein